MDKYTQLTDALLKAKEAAKEFENTEDGGTCNFDSPAIDYRAMHMNKSKTIEAIKAAGLHAFEWKFCGIKLVVSDLGKGQGNRNTRMAEAAHRSLTESGIISEMYYQMD